MSLKSILFAGTAVAALIASALSASADSYNCSYGCYDDQAGETRELNLMAFDHARLQRIGDDDDDWGWTGDGDDDDDDADADEFLFSPWPDDGDDDDDDGDDGEDD